MNMTIDKVYAVISSNEKGEGICAIQDGNGVWVPLVGSTDKSLAVLLDKAKEMAAREGILIKVLQFETRSTLEEFDGRQ